MKGLQTSGYQSQSLTSDILLGLFEGVDGALWCYAFATMLFAGVMSVFLPLGVLILLVGWAIMNIVVIATSQARLHITSIDEQGVAILASVGVLMVAYMGKDASQARGLATMLALMALSSFAVAVSFIWVGYYRLTRLLELLPYPVICGFMAGVGWLLLESAVFVTAGEHISSDLFKEMAGDQSRWILVTSLLCSFVLMAATTVIRKAWALPLATVLIFTGFYVVTGMLGLSSQQLVEEGWLFDISTSGDGALSLLAGLSLADVDTYFLLSALPQVLTIVFLALLSASMSLTTLSAAGRKELDTSEEMKNLGAGNLMCSLICCPPGYTDIAGSVVYREFGASSRWMPIVSSGVCLSVALIGTWLVGYMPKVLVGAGIFLFAFQMFYEWMYRNVRGFQPIDFGIVCVILGTVIFVGFMVGIVTGIILTLLLFVLRYSMISAIQGRYSLRDYRSSVERPSGTNQVLDEHGSGALIYTLRGFLFFGTANAILDQIKKDLGSGDTRYLAVVLDMKRVTGIDISALNTFVQVRNKCESARVLLMYSGVPRDIDEKIMDLEAVSKMGDRSMFFVDLDFAVEYLETLVLEKFAAASRGQGIREHLKRVLGDDEKIDLLIGSMDQVTCPAGSTLFRQNDTDTGFYILESGSLSAYIGAHSDGLRRVKKFGPGSLIGEMSSYSADRKRTATVIAEDDSVLYHMSSETLEQLDQQDYRLAAIIHELIARTLGSRISYMNRRLLLELE